MSMASFWEKIIHFCSEVLEIFPKIFRSPSLRRPSALKNLENAPWEGAWKTPRVLKRTLKLENSSFVEARRTLPHVAWHNFCTTIAKFSEVTWFFIFTLQLIRDGHWSIMLHSAKTLDRGTISVSFLSLLSSSHPSYPFGVQFNSSLLHLSSIPQPSLILLLFSSR